jgi:sugar/nucleoside kinase (ribokinase family)
VVVVRHPQPADKRQAAAASQPAMSNVTFHIVGDAYVDFFCFLDGEWPENGGDSRLEHPVKSYAGGSSINTATHLKSLTHHFHKHAADGRDKPSVTLHTVLNPDDAYGKLLLQHAQDHDFPLVNCRSPEDESFTGHCIVIVSGGERSFMTHQGCVERFRAAHLDMDDIIETDSDIHVHVAGFFNVEGFHHGDLRDQLVRLREGRAARQPTRGTTVSLVTQHDASKEWDGGLDQVIPHVDFLIMNELEAERIWQRGMRQQNKDSTPSAAPIQDWLAFFSPLNPEACIIVTMGPEGAVAFRNGQILATLQPAIAVQAVDPTGAGDSFSAGFLHGLSSWAPADGVTATTHLRWCASAIAEGLDWGCAAGTAAVKIRGASNPSPPAAILDLLAQQQEKNAVACGEALS